ncbi:MAG: MBL fold metallo-hydrolase [Muribaculaceae bacterium]|nr:MBL fold metallo-hydrolase [Muribaculaceae bacterium]
MEKITYLDHSGFAVVTPTAILVFDYYRDPAHSLKKVLHEYPSRPVIFLVSHHHEDHFNRDIFDLAQDHKRTYVLSNDIESKVTHSDVGRRHCRGSSRRHNRQSLRLNRYRSKLPRNITRRQNHFSRRRPQLLALATGKHSYRSPSRLQTLRLGNDTPARRRKITLRGILPRRPTHGAGLLARRTPVPVQHQRQVFLPDALLGRLPQSLRLRELRPRQHREPVPAHSRRNGRTHRRQSHAGKSITHPHHRHTARPARPGSRGASRFYLSFYYL